MPRLPQSLLLQAHNISPLLPLLVCVTRSLPSALNELRWLREHAFKASKTLGYSPNRYQQLLLRLCQQRARGVPLQYLLRSQPFGNLDILCRPGVLIPRPETEAYTSCVADILRSDTAFEKNVNLRVLDLCTGTGCIILSLFALLDPEYPQIEALGVDVSDMALKLARENLMHNVALGHLATAALKNVSFMKVNLLSNGTISDTRMLDGKKWDIVISNPPYISETGFNKDTSRSVRNWEPKLALVPPDPQSKDPRCSRSEDIFYPRIIDIATLSNAKIALMEVAGTEQALRVAQIALDMGFWKSVEVWRDWAGYTGDFGESTNEVIVGGHVVAFKGAGHGRAVVCKQ